MYSAGGGTYEHVFVCFIGYWVDERLNPIETFVSFESASTEIVQVFDGNERCFFVVYTLTRGRDNDFLVILS
jgi:hypothetical protein